MPTPPANSVTIDCLPDGDGIVFSEDWSAAFARWYVDPNNRSSPASVNADDGLMGTGYARLGNPSVAQADLTTISSRTWFDQTQPIRVIYRFRAVYGALPAGIGIGILYVGEPSYVGLWADSGWGSNGGNAAFGLYQLDAYLTRDAVYGYVELEWVPSTCTIRWRTSPAGAWTSRSGDFSPYLSDTTPYLGWPVVFNVQSPWVNGQALGAFDVGAVQIAGTPMYGSADLTGFYEWTTSNASYFDALDLNYYLGGLVGTPQSGETYLGYNNPTETVVSRTWNAQSPIIVPAGGYQYSELRFMAYYPRSVLKLQVCDAITGDPLPESEVPGNLSAQGLVGAASTVSGSLIMGSGNGSVGTQRVSLASVPTSRQIFLHVEGQSDPAWGGLLSQPRLGGVWVSFDTIGLTATAGTVSGGSATLSGYRDPGTTVTVTRRA